MMVPISRHVAVASAAPTSDDGMDSAVADDNS